MKTFVAAFLSFFLFVSDPLLFASKIQNQSAPLLKIPSKYARLEESFAGTNGKTILYIQDAHDSLDAQISISRLISYLVDKRGVKTVFEEGYEGEVPSDRLFGFIKNKELKRKVSYFLLDQLRLGGAEFAHINRKKNFRLIGADSIQQHRQNIQAYQKSAQSQRQISEDLQRISDEIEKLMKRYFSADLKKFVRLKKQLNQEQIDILSYLEKISGRKFNLNHLAPMGVEEILKEKERLEQNRLDQLALNARDKKIYEYSETLELLKRLNRMEISQAEFRQVRDSLIDFKTEDIADFIFKLDSKPLVLSKAWESFVSDALRFYEIAESRDQYLDKQLQDFQKESDEKVAVLVFGGFHQGNIKRILQENKFSYCLLSPPITNFDTRHQAIYRQLMESDHLPFEVSSPIATATRAASAYSREIQIGASRTRFELERICLAVAQLSRKINEPELLNREIERYLRRPELRRNTVLPFAVQTGDNLFDPAERVLSRVLGKRKDIFRQVMEYVTAHQGGQKPSDQEKIRRFQLLLEQDAPFTLAGESAKPLQNLAKRYALGWPAPANMISPNRPYISMINDLDRVLDGRWASLQKGSVEDVLNRAFQGLLDFYFYYYIQLLYTRMAENPEANKGKLKMLLDDLQNSSEGSRQKFVSYEGTPLKLLGSLLSKDEEEYIRIERFMLPFYPELAAIAGRGYGRHLRFVHSEGEEETDYSPAEDRRVDNGMDYAVLALDLMPLLRKFEALREKPDPVEMEKNAEDLLGAFSADPDLLTDDALLFGLRANRERAHFGFKLFVPSQLRGKEKQKYSALVRRNRFEIADRIEEIQWLKPDPKRFSPLGIGVLFSSPLMQAIVMTGILNPDFANFTFEDFLYGEKETTLKFAWVQNVKEVLRYMNSHRVGDFGEMFYMPYSQVRATAVYEKTLRALRRYISRVKPNEVEDFGRQHFVERDSTALISILGQELFQEFTYPISQGYRRQGSVAEIFAINYFSGIKAVLGNDFEKRFPEILEWFGEFIVQSEKMTPLMARIHQLRRNQADPKSAIEQLRGQVRNLRSELRQSNEDWMSWAYEAAPGEARLLVRETERVFGDGSYPFGADDEPIGPKRELSTASPSDLEKQALFQHLERKLSDLKLSPEKFQKIADEVFSYWQKWKQVNQKPLVDFYPHLELHPLSSEQVMPRLKDLIEKIRGERAYVLKNDYDSVYFEALRIQTSLDGLQDENQVYVFGLVCEAIIDALKNADPKAPRARISFVPMISKIEIRNAQIGDLISKNPEKGLGIAIVLQIGNGTANSGTMSLSVSGISQEDFKESLVILFKTLMRARQPLTRTLFSKPVIGQEKIGLMIKRHEKVGQRMQVDLVRVERSQVTSEFQHEKPEVIADVLVRKLLSLPTYSGPLLPKRPIPKSQTRPLLFHTIEVIAFIQADTSVLSQIDWSQDSPVRSELRYGSDNQDPRIAYGLKVRDKLRDVFARQNYLEPFDIQIDDGFPSGIYIKTFPKLPEVRRRLQRIEDGQELRIHIPIGSIGRQIVSLIEVDGETSFYIEEAHPSRGFRHLVKYQGYLHDEDAVKKQLPELESWNHRVNLAILQTAKELGMKTVYAKTAPVAELQNVEMGHGKAIRFYHRPFAGLFHRRFTSFRNIFLTAEQLQNELSRERREEDSEKYYYGGDEVAMWRLDLEKIDLTEIRDLFEARFFHPPLYHYQHFKTHLRSPGFSFGLITPDGALSREQIFQKLRDSGFDVTEAKPVGMDERNVQKVLELSSLDSRFQYPSLGKFARQVASGPIIPVLIHKRRGQHPDLNLLLQQIRESLGAGIRKPRILLAKSHDDALRQMDIVYMKSQARSELRLDTDKKFHVTLEMLSRDQANQFATLVKDGVDGITIPDPDRLARYFSFVVGFFRRVTGKVQGSVLDHFSNFLNRENPNELFAVAANPIYTVAANGARRATLQARMNYARQNGAKGLFLVSGGLQRLFPSWLRSVFRFWPLNVFDLLQMAKTEESNMPIYASANPNLMTDAPSRLGEKIYRGAQVILTHPPFLWDPFRIQLGSWREAGLTGKVSIRVSLPIPVSPSHLKVLLFATGIRWKKYEETRKLVGDFEAAWAQGKEKFKEFRNQWVIDQIARIRQEFPEVEGVHLFPPKKGFEDTTQILEKAGLISKAEDLSEQIQTNIQALEALGVRTVGHDPDLLIKGRYARRFNEALVALRNVAERIPAAERRPFDVFWGWLFYEHHFRQAVAIRYVNDSSAATGSARHFQFSFDLKQLEAKSASELERIFSEKLNQARENRVESDGGILLEENFAPHSQSLSWKFNNAFWQHNQGFMRAMERDYRDSIGGSPDTNRELIRYTAGKYLAQLAEVYRQESPNGPIAPLYFLEIGVASVDHAQIFVEELVAQATASNQTHLLSLTRYVLADFSQEILNAAAEKLGDQYHGVQLEYVRVDAQSPYETLALRYRGRILRYHATNVFSNLPTDKLARRNGDYYQVRSRLYLPEAGVNNLLQKYEPKGLTRTRLSEDLARLRASGDVNAFLDAYRKLFADEKTFYQFWQDLWNELKLEEDYFKIPDLSKFDFLNDPDDPAAPRFPKPGPALQDLWDRHPKDRWMHLANVGAKSILQMHNLLHVEGVIEVVDIIIESLDNYDRFRGPVKYDGSETDYFNWPVVGAMLAKYFPASSHTLTSLSKFGEKRAQRKILEIKRGQEAHLVFEPEVYAQARQAIGSGLFDGLSQFGLGQGERWVLTDGMRYADNETSWTDQKLRQSAYAEGRAHETNDLGLIRQTNGRNRTLQPGETQVPVILPQDGKVLWVFEDSMRYTVVIESDIEIEVEGQKRKMIFVYTHMQPEDWVRPGAQVRQGQNLGNMESSFRPNSPVMLHLHFAVGLIDPALIQIPNEEMDYPTKLHKWAQEGRLKYLDFMKILSPDQRKKLFVEGFSARLGVREIVVVNENQSSRKEMSGVIGRAFPGVRVTVMGKSRDAVNYVKRRHGVIALVIGDFDKWRLDRAEPARKIDRVLFKKNGQGKAELLQQLTEFEFRFRGPSRSELRHGTLTENDKKIFGFLKMDDSIFGWDNDLARWAVEANYSSQDILNSFTRILAAGLPSREVIFHMWRYLGHHTFRHGKLVDYEPILRVLLSRAWTTQRDMKDGETHPYWRMLEHLLNLDLPKINDAFGKVAEDFIFSSENERVNIRKGKTIYYDDAQKLLAEKMPTLVKIIEDPKKVRRLVFVLTLLRKAFPYDRINTFPQVPIGSTPEFKMGREGLRVVPVSESFRRFVFYVPEGRHSYYAIELKIPGEAEGKEWINAEHFYVSRTMWNRFGRNSLTAKPLFFVQYWGKDFRAYGKHRKNFNHTPVGIMAFRYRAGKRIRNVFEGLPDMTREYYLKRLARRNRISTDALVQKVIAEVVSGTVMLHYLGYSGLSQEGGGSDMHDENIRLVETPAEAEFVGDFSVFHRKRLSLAERRKELDSNLNFMDFHYPFDEARKRQIFPRVKNHLTQAAKNQGEARRMIRKAEELLFAPKRSELRMHRHDRAGKAILDGYARVHGAKHDVIHSVLAVLPDDMESHPSLEHARMWARAWMEAAQGQSDIVDQQISYYLAGNFLAFDDPQKAAIQSWQNEHFAEARKADYRERGLSPPEIKRADIPFRGKKIPGYLIEPEGRRGDSLGEVAVLLHGLTGSKETPFFHLPERELIARGISVFRPDLLGHGENDLLVESSQDLAEYVSAIIRNFRTRKVHLIGFSLGGRYVLGGVLANSRNPNLKFATIINAPVQQFFISPDKFHIMDRYLEIQFAQSGGSINEKMERLSISDEQLAGLKSLEPRLKFYVGDKDLAVAQREVGPLETALGSRNAIFIQQGMRHYPNREQQAVLFSDIANSIIQRSELRFQSHKGLVMMPASVFEHPGISEKAQRDLLEEIVGNLKMRPEIRLIIYNSDPATESSAISLLRTFSNVRVLRFDGEKSFGFWAAKNSGRVVHFSAGSEDPRSEFRFADREMDFFRDVRGEGNLFSAALIFQLSDGKVPGFVRDSNGYYTVTEFLRSELRQYQASLVIRIAA